MWILYPEHLQANRAFYSFKVLCTGLSHKQQGCTLGDQDVHYFDPYDCRGFSLHVHYLMKEKKTILLEK